MQRILEGDNLEVLKQLQTEGILVDLIYIDPPFNTGRTQKRNELFYEDKFDDYLAFLNARLTLAKSLMKHTASLFLHIGVNESHYVKIMLDSIFGRNNFRNQIIWAYDYGGRTKKRWSNKHDIIFWYTCSEEYTYNYSDIDRIPYLAPSLVGKEKAERGKVPTDVWWQTIVHTNGKEKTGYPTQKPLKILERIIRTHSNEGDLVLDFFAGSGTTGEACKKLNRNYILVDKNPEAIKIMRERLCNI